MRTTITIADDVYAEMERMRREEGLGPSEALNTLARRGMARSARVDYVFEPVAFDMGYRIDVTNVGEVLDLLDQEDA
ncbi:MAG TPA: CopG family transcriptional regulator [Propionibacterium sp.]|nr:CopG family transcriptional regulator [Propionibacterium sp.]